MLLLVAITTGHLCAPYPVSNAESFSYSSVFACHKCLFACGQQQLLFDKPVFTTRVHNKITVRECLTASIFPNTLCKVIMI